MWNPFKTPANAQVVAFNPQGGYAGDSEAVPDDHDTANSYYPSGTVQMDDAYYPGTDAPNLYRGNVNDVQQTERPPYAGADRRVIVTDANPLPAYTFLAPAPGSTDLIEARDSNSVPGHSDLNYAVGPVSGWAMDNYQEGNRQVLATTPPGAYGPVVGGQDYSSIVSNATFQDSFAAYSTAASDQTIVSAI